MKPENEETKLLREALEAHIVRADGLKLELDKLQAQINELERAVAGIGTMEERHR